MTTALILAAVFTHAAERAAEAAHRDEGEGFDLSWELQQGTVGELFGFDDDRVDFDSHPELCGLYVDAFSFQLGALGVTVR